MFYIRLSCFFLFYLAYWSIVILFQMTKQCRFTSVYSLASNLQPCTLMCYVFTSQHTTHTGTVLYKAPSWVDARHFAIARQFIWQGTPRCALWIMLGKNTLHILTLGRERGPIMLLINDFTQRSAVRDCQHANNIYCLTPRLYRGNRRGCWLHRST